MIPSTTETTVILEQVTDFAGQTLPQALDYVQNLSATYGPKAYELVLWKVRIDCISDVTLWVCGAVASVALAATCAKACRWANEADSRCDGMGVPYGFLVIVAGIADFFLIGFLIDGLFPAGIWPLIGVFNPELKLASDIINKVLQ